MIWIEAEQRKEVVFPSPENAGIALDDGSASGCGAHLLPPRVTAVHLFLRIHLGSDTDDQ